MYDADVALLRCPASGAALSVGRVARRADDGELLEAELVAGERRYAVRNGIPRFAEDVASNASWDYKWRVLDRGRGLNYRILDKADQAYAIHDIFDRNSHGGAAFRHMAGGVALDLGCGVGQYAVKALLEYRPRKLVAVDLTGGVDIFRQIVESRYPELKAKLLIVQANVFDLPFAARAFDYVYSLGVLMHTGQTLRALDNACGLVADNGEINVWVYCSEPLAYDAIEPGRGGALTIANVSTFIRRLRYPMFWIHLFRRIPHDRAVQIVTFFSSDGVYRLSKRPGFRWIGRLFPSVDHPDRDYRLINNYDGYVNTWADTWSEHEVFPVFRRQSIAVLGISDWRLGVWGRRIPGFYEDAR